MIGVGDKVVCVKANWNSHPNCRDLKSMTIGAVHEVRGTQEYNDEIYLRFVGLHDAYMISYFRPVHTTNIDCFLAIDRDVFDKAPSLV